MRPLESDYANRRSVAGRNAAIELGALSKPLFGAIERLINLLAEPECIPVLSPLVQKEIVSGIGHI